MKKLMVLFVLLLMISVPVFPDEFIWEFKEISFVTKLTTWTTSDVVYSPGTWPENKVHEFPTETVFSQALTYLNKNNFSEWDILKIEPYYTKNTEYNKEGLAGKFWLGIKIWLKRKISQPAV